jgi:DNA-binding HxlR family transcriptional regulator
MRPGRGSAMPQVTGRPEAPVGRLERPLIPHELQMTGPDPARRSTSARGRIAKPLDALQTRSALLILREAFYGTTRFDGFARRAGLSQPTTAARLCELVEAELLERHDYRKPGQRTRQEYRLTEKGADLFTRARCGHAVGRPLAGRGGRPRRTPPPRLRRACGGRAALCDRALGVPRRAGSYAASSSTAHRTHGLRQRATDPERAVLNGRRGSAPAAHHKPATDDWLGVMDIDVLTAL